MAITNAIFGISVDDFFSYWGQNGGNFLKANSYNPLVVYALNDIIEFKGNFYQSLMDQNSNPPLPVGSIIYWNQVLLPNLVTNFSVASAMQQAYGLFNEELFADSYDSNGNIVKANSPVPSDTLTGFTIAQIGFILLTSHYVVNNQYAKQFQGAPNHVVSSSSVGGVSQTNKFNSRIENKMLLNLDSTEYGRQYLEMTNSFTRISTLAFVAGCNEY